MPQKLVMDGEGCNLKVVDARASFVTVFRPKAQSEGGEPKYSINFLLHKTKDAEVIKDLKAAVLMVAESKWGKGKAPKTVVFGGDRCCLKEANLKDYDGYDSDHLVVSASSPRPIPVVGRDLTPLAEADGKPYSGCYVNGSVRLWAQDNKFGRRVNAQLRAVQFVRDGEAFGAGTVDASKEFESLAEDADPFAG
jgi:hypothetical protein